MNLDDFFTTAALSESINKLPVTPTRLGELNIFEESGVPSTSIVIESRDGRLFLVPNTNRNDDPSPVKSDKRTRRTFETTHLPVSDQLLPSDLQNLQPFGGNETSDYQSRIINDKLETMKRSLDVTREWQRIGAISGKILDADGTVIYDLYDEFKVKQRIIPVKLSVATTDVRKLLLAAKRHAESKLTGVLVSGYKAFCGPDWFDAFTGHELVKAAYANYQEAADRLGGDMRSGFTYAGIVFEEYNATVSKQEFIPSHIARLVPLAKGGMYKTFNAPANYNETVNTLGEPYYAKSEPRKMGKGWDLEAQSNPLSICTYPEALVELRAE